MPNGSIGAYVYFDFCYTGSGSKTTACAALSGGLGKLTDGVSTSSSWDAASNSQGTGAYIGWNRANSGCEDPLLTFNFNGNPVINEISIQMDNTGQASVYAPASILIDGVNHSFTAPTQGTVGSVIFTDLGLTGSTHTIKLIHRTPLPSWMMVSEISFLLKK